MRTFLLLVVVLAVFGSTMCKQGHKRFNKVKFFKKCQDECKMPREAVMRIDKWEFKKSPEEKCFMICTFHLAEMTTPLGAFDVDKFSAPYIANGETPPARTEDFRGVIDPDKMFDIYIDWVKDRKAIDKYYFDYEPAKEV